MKKHIKILSMLLASIMLVGAFTACGKEDKKSRNETPDTTNEVPVTNNTDKNTDTADTFIGTWREFDENGNHKSEIMIFTADGYYMAYSASGRGIFGEWYTVGNKFIFKATMNGRAANLSGFKATMNGQAADISGTYEFSNDTVKLTYDDGDVEIYKKIEKMEHESVIGNDARLTGLWQEVDENGNLKSEKMILASDGTGMATDTSGYADYIEWGADGIRFSRVIIHANLWGKSTGTYKISGDTITYTYDDGYVDIYKKVNS